MNNKIIKMTTKMTTKMTITRMMTTKTALLQDLDLAQLPPQEAVPPLEVVLLLPQELILLNPARLHLFTAVPTPTTMVSASVSATRASTLRMVCALLVNLAKPTPTETPAESVYAPKVSISMVLSAQGAPLEACGVHLLIAVSTSVAKTVLSLLALESACATLDLVF